MASMTGILILKLDSQVFETEEGSIELDLGGEVYESKVSPATGRVNNFSKLMPGRATATIHNTKECDVEFLRRFRAGEVVAECRDTGKQWQMNNASIGESVKLQDNGRGMPLVLVGDPWIQTKSG